MPMSLRSEVVLMNRRGGPLSRNMQKGSNMKKLLILCTAFFCSSASFAQSFSQGYAGVNSVVCKGKGGNLSADVSKQTLSGMITDGRNKFNLSFKPFSKESSRLGLFPDHNLFGGAVESDDKSSFGVLGVDLINKAFKAGSKSEYVIKYVDFITEATIRVTAMCVFK